MPFELESNYEPRGDQGEAIDKLTRSLLAGNRHQTLLGVTGSGKTFTVANVIQALDRPTLVMSHNKTLAAQLYSEFKQFFPRQRRRIFCKLFRLLPARGIYPAHGYLHRKGFVHQRGNRAPSSFGRQFAPLPSRHDRRRQCLLHLRPGLSGRFPANARNDQARPDDDARSFSREARRHVYERNDIAFGRGKFRVRGDVVEVHQAQVDDQAIRVEFFGDEIERISQFDPLTGRVSSTLSTLTIYPAKQFVTPHEKLKSAVRSIREELDERVKELERENKLIEAQRVRQRTEFDLEMMQEMGFCNGIENYSRHLSGRPPGSRPYTLIDFMPEDFLVIIDESHATVPQIGGMFAGDRSRKTVLVNYGFRLPSALDNRPLSFEEFMAMTGQIVYVSATPGDFELRNSVVGNDNFIANPDQQFREQSIPAILAGSPEGRNPKGEFDPFTTGSRLVVEQVIRPTGLLDPKITVKALKNQIDETIELCQQRIAKGERVLVTTLTKRTAEDLADYLRDIGLKVRYLHSDIDTIERVEILRGLRAGECDVLVGINLLREGLDLPEVSLVCILDADKEGYLRSQTSLIQTAGRAARHIHGEVVLFADHMTNSMQRLLDVSEYRRARQLAYNEENGITPTSVKRAVQESLHVILHGREVEQGIVREAPADFDLGELIRELERDMAAAAAGLEYERAALLRDQLAELKSGTGIARIEPKKASSKYKYPVAKRSRRKSPAA